MPILGFIVGEGEGVGKYGVNGGSYSSALSLDSLEILPAFLMLSMIRYVAIFLTFSKFSLPVMLSLKLSFESQLLSSSPGIPTYVTLFYLPNFKDFLFSLYSLYT